MRAQAQLEFFGLILIQKPGSTFGVRCIPSASLARGLRNLRNDRALQYNSRSQGTEALNRCRVTYALVPPLSYRVSSMPSMAGLERAKCGGVGPAVESSTVYATRLYSCMSDVSPLPLSAVTCVSDVYLSHIAAGTFLPWTRDRRILTVSLTRDVL